MKIDKVEQFLDVLIKQTELNELEWKKIDKNFINTNILFTRTFCKEGFINEYDFDIESVHNYYTKYNSSYIYIIEIGARFGTELFIQRSLNDPIESAINNIDSREKMGTYGEKLYYLVELTSRIASKSYVYDFIENFIAATKENEKE